MHLFEIFMCIVTITYFFSAHHHMPRTQQEVIFKAVNNWSGTGTNHLERLLPESLHGCVPALNRLSTWHRVENVTGHQSIIVK